MSYFGQSGSFFSQQGWPWLQARSAAPPRNGPPLPLRYVDAPSIVYPAHHLLLTGPLPWM